MSVNDGQRRPTSAPLLVRARPIWGVSFRFVLPDEQLLTETLPFDAA